MKITKKSWIVISAVFLIASVSITTLVYFSPYPPIKPKTIPMGDFGYTIDYANYEIKKIMKQDKVPSIAIALIDDQEVVWQNAEGYANAEEKIEANMETYYRVGSISKVFTAIEIMRLVEDGLLELDTPLIDIISNFSIQNRFNDNTSITIQHLLEHRSGLPRNGNLPTWYWDAGVDILKEIAESLKYSYAAYPVGYRFKYSNAGFDILGHVIELLREELYAFHMKTNLLEAIGMNDSTFLSQDIPSSGTLAVGHSLEKRNSVPVDQHDIISLPSGNLYSTVSDMAEFAKFLFRGGMRNNDQLIENSTLQSMYQIQSSTTRDPKRMGLGWFTGLLKQNEKVVYHSGGIQGTHSLFAFLPERKIGVVLIGNSFVFEQSINQFGWKLLELMLETKEGITYSNPIYNKVSLTPAQLETFTGKYIIDFSSNNIYLKKDKLKVDALGTTLNLIPMSNSKFKLDHWFVDPGNIDIEFFSGDDLIDKFAMINYFGADYDFLPSYPELTELPPSWEKFLGTYEIYPRNETSYADDGPYGTLELEFNDNMLKLGENYYLKPISDTEILVLSSPFAYETMKVDPLTGNIFWQHDIFKPIERGSQSST